MRVSVSSSPTGATGLEPATPGFGDRCSAKLSYAPVLDQSSRIRSPLLFAGRSTATPHRHRRWALPLSLSNEKQVVDDPVAGAFRRHYAQVYRFLRRRTESDEVAEELAQAVFVHAAERLRHLDRRGPPLLAWLYTVARRRLVDRARASARGPASIASLDEARARPVSPELEYGGELAGVLAKALRDLPEGQRHVVVMRLLEGRSFREIGENLGATEAACKMRFSRGLEALRTELSRRGVEP
jgi:RNA polymerase sigma-70 factor, ECF subfamily